MDKFLYIILIIVFIVIIIFKPTHFDKYIRGKDIIICGNSPKFDELYKKINVTNNSVIVRFNDAIKYYPHKSSTDVYVYGRAMNLTENKIKKLENKYKFVFGSGRNEVYRSNHILNNIELESPTTGFRFFTWILTKKHLVNSITILGFNMESLKSHGFDNKNFSRRHDRINEPKQLKKLVDKYKINYLQ